MSHFFIDCNMVIHRPGQCYFFIFYKLRKSQQDTNAEFIVQKTALNIAVFCNRGTRVKTYEISGQNAKCESILLCFDFFIKHHFHDIIRTGGFIELTVYMNRRVTQLKCSCINFSVTRVNLAVFTFSIVRIHAAHGG